ASPRRSVCAPNGMSSNCFADPMKDRPMTFSSKFSRLFGVSQNVQLQKSRRKASIGRVQSRALLCLESLEERAVPAALSVADVTVREGPAYTGILDPVGAATVGVNGIKGIAFDRGPSDAHFGDLFVTSSLSHMVARFDWASQTYQPFV